MKNRLLTTSLLLLAAMGVLFASCKKEYPTPPIQNLPIGTVYTIDQIIAMTPGTVFDTASVYGIITADEQSGNLYKAAYMQDRATGAAIQLYLNATSGVRIGDSVRIYLKDVKFDMYHGLPQLSDFGPDGHIIILANNRPIEPAVTTLSNVLAGQHLAGLIRLEGVSFVDQEGTFAPSTGYGERYIQDAFGNTAMVRTSNYANFANNPLPQGTGNLVAIASVYNTTWQLTLRSYYELEFDGMGPGPITPGEAQPLPYTQLFSSGFGTYMTYSVLGDEQFWKIDYSSAVMTGHVKVGDEHFYYENEDWLISSPVNLDVEHAKAIVSYAAQYTGPSNDVTMQVSSNYEYGTDPSQASWTELSVTYPNSNGWNFQEVEASLDEFLGQTVTVAIKFVSSTSASRTFEVQSITIMEGEAGDTPTPPEPGTGIFSETFANGQGNFTIQDVVLPSDLTYVWMHDSSRKHMKASAFKSGTPYETESWLVSPEIAIPGDINSVAMTFDQAINYAEPQGAIHVMISADYAGDVTAATWTELEFDQWPVNDGNWTFVNSKIDLSSYLNQTVTVAFKYTSQATQEGCPTWEVKNIVVE